MLDDWLSYSIADFIPIEMSVYINLFARANEDLWPWTLLAALFGVVAIFLVIKQQVRYCYALLGAAWFFCAYQFHFNLLNELHSIGFFLAVLFFIQGCLLVVAAVIPPKGSQDKSQTKNQKQSHKLKSIPVKFCILIMLAGMILPLLFPAFSERTWQSTEIFAIAPNPTSLLSLGAILALNARRWWLFIIPSLWFILSLMVFYATWQ